MPYVADPTNRLLPVDSEFIANGPNEFRTLKGYIQDVIVNPATAGSLASKVVYVSGLAANLPLNGFKITGGTLIPTTLDELTSAGYVQGLFALFGSGAYFLSTSISPTLIALGNVVVTEQIMNRAWAVGMPIRLASLANPSNFMQGIITAYNAATGLLTVSVTITGGAGTYSDWQIGPDALINPITNSSIGSARRGDQYVVNHAGTNVIGEHRFVHRSGLRRLKRRVAINI